MFCIWCIPIPVHFQVKWLRVWQYLLQVELLSALLFEVVLKSFTLYLTYFCSLAPVYSTYLISMLQMQKRASCVTAGRNYRGSERTKALVSIWWNLTPSQASWHGAFPGIWKLSPDEYCSRDVVFQFQSTKKLRATDKKDYKNLPFGIAIPTFIRPLIVKSLSNPENPNT